MTELKQAALNDGDLAPEALKIPGAEVVLHPGFLSVLEADRLLQVLLAQTQWRQDIMRFGGKKVLVPRLQAWHGDKKSSYGYSGLQLAPRPWSKPLLWVKRKIEDLAEAEFNSVLLNYYRDGKDSVSWHSDNERELGPDPIIASLSLGATRCLELKCRFHRRSPIKCDLSHGSLLIMGAGLQRNWQHRVPKQPEISHPRVNLTFRRVF